jgi:PleD family two-component response regulator
VAHPYEQGLRSPADIRGHGNRPGGAYGCAHDKLFPPKHWIAISLAISTVMPMLLAATVIIIFLRMAHTMERAREMIAKLAMTGMLTGIYNRRYFMLEAPKEFEKAVRYKPLSPLSSSKLTGFSLLMTHMRILQAAMCCAQLGITCGRCLRASDVFARYGEEKFVILLPLTKDASPFELAERLRRAVEEMTSQSGGISLPATIRLGGAECLSTMVSIDEMLKKAELWLYEAKRNGRNRVEDALKSF